MKSESEAGLLTPIRHVPRHIIGTHCILEPLTLKQTAIPRFPTLSNPPFSLNTQYRFIHGVAHRENGRGNGGGADSGSERRQRRRSAAATATTATATDDAVWVASKCHW
jgi:hypothetical protein